MNIKEILLILLIFLISIGGSYYIGTLNSKYDKIYIDKFHSDTVTIIKHDSIRLIAKGKIVYDITEQEIIIKDTVKIKVLPFYSKLDSVVNNDTCSLAYYYPQNRFELGIKRKQDSIVTITKYIELKEETAWYDSKPFNIVVGVLGGIGLGMLLK